MARAFFCLARNDVPAASLQVQDLKPRSEHSRKGSATFGKNGQTGYLAWLPQTTSLVDPTDVTDVGGVRTAQKAIYGLVPYLMDHVENQTGDVCLTVAIANAVKNAILARVVAGQTLTLADINTTLTANGVANAGANTNLDGEGASNSTGTVEEVLRILSGEVFRIPSGAAISGAGAGFLSGRAGGFVSRPNVETPLSVNGLAGKVRGRSSFKTPMVPNDKPVQTGLQDTTFRDIRRILDTGDVHKSALLGNLSPLLKSTFTWKNSKFTYGGGAAPAQTVAGVNLAATGSTAFQGRAVVVYDATGALI